MDAAGNLYVADSTQFYVYRVSLLGDIQKIAGNGTQGSAGDGGPATSASLGYPFCVAVDANSNLLIGEYFAGRVRRVTPDGIISTMAGSGQFRFTGDGGAGANAALNSPHGVAIDSKDRVYIADTHNHRGRRVTPDGIITTFAGNGTAVFAGDGGAAINATLNTPTDVVVDSAGSVYITDSRNYAIRKVSVDGIISTPARLVTVCAGAGQLAIGSDDNVYIADGAHVHRMVPDGRITVLAGTGLILLGYPGSGDGGPATDANISACAIAVDAQHNVYILDSNRIRKITPDGIIHSIPGAPEGGHLLADSSGRVYVSGPNGVSLITGDSFAAVAGNGEPGFFGDGGPAIEAMLNGTSGIAFDRRGNLFIADSGNDRVRVVLAEPPLAAVSRSELQFTAPSGGAPTDTQMISFTSSVTGLAFSTQVSDDGRWLRVSPTTGFSPRLIEVSADPSGLSPGVHLATITINAPHGTPAAMIVSVTFTVTTGLGPKLALDKSSLSFPFPRAGSPGTQILTVSNAGGGTLDFAVSAEASSTDEWLSAHAARLTALPGAPATVEVTADPTGLPSGTYTGAIVVSTPAGNPQTIPVTMTISTLDQAIRLSQAGLSFTAVAQGGIVPPQAFGVLSIGTGVVNWSASASTLPAGLDWLRITPANGSTEAAARDVPAVQVNVDPAGLAPGRHYGLVRVDAPGAANTPQVVTTFLEVLPPESDVGPILLPSELVFSTVAGAQSPGSQEVLCYNLTSTAKSFRSSAGADAGLSLVTLPTDAKLDPQQPTRIAVQPFTEGLGPGVYSGSLAFQFSDGRVGSLRVRVIVASAAAVSSGPRAVKPTGGAIAAGSCTPTKLLPAITSLGSSFAVSAGWPVALRAQVKDDCGTPMDSGVVAVEFSNGDPPSLLESLKDGRWEGTWATTGRTVENVTLRVRAEDLKLQIRGEREVSGVLQSQTDPPLFDAAGVVSAADGPPYIALAPGGMISIYGNRLAESAISAASSPLPPILDSTEVLIAGRRLPLLFVSQTQVNAILPFSIITNTTHQLLIRRGLTYSRPVPVDVAPAQPAVFVVGPSRQGIIVGARTQSVADSNGPAKAGDVVTIYCSGLGSVDPPVADGAQPETQPSLTTNGVQVLIGTRPAQVLFAGLAPGFVGLYQVNAIVPAGVVQGPAIPVTLRVGGQSSPEVTMAIQ